MQVVRRKEFFTRIDKSTTNSCHLWTGGKDSKGYGVYYAGSLAPKPTIKVHRWMYEDVNNVQLDPWFAVKHTCKNRLCVNSEHLYVIKNRKIKPDAYKHRMIGPRPHTWKWGTDPRLKDMNISYLRMKAQCKYRDEVFELTFEDYVKIWYDKWKLRGRSEGSLNLTRKNPNKAWTFDNIVLVVRREYLEAWRSKKHLNKISSSKLPN